MTERPRIIRLDSSATDAIHDLWNRTGLIYKPKGRDARERLRRVISEGIEVFFGIHDQGKLVGVVLVTHDGRKGWINRIAVDPAYQRLGFARFLIQRAEEYLHGEGIEIVAALIEDWNEQSIRLFQSCGYILHDDVHYLSKREHPDV